MENPLTKESLQVAVCTQTFIPLHNKMMEVALIACQVWSSKFLALEFLRFKQVVSVQDSKLVLASC